jgi:hypothetical protein
MDIISIAPAPSGTQGCKQGLNDDAGSAFAWLAAPARTEIASWLSRQHFNQPAVATERHF